jgi:hypothetical protein
MEQRRRVSLIRNMTFFLTHVISRNVGRPNLVAAKPEVRISLSKAV